MMFSHFLKKCHLGPQNGYGISTTEKLPKRVNYATIIETKRNNGTIVGVKVEWVGGDKYPPGSTWKKKE